MKRNIFLLLILSITAASFAMDPEPERKKLKAEQEKAEMEPQELGLQPMEVEEQPAAPAPQQPQVAPSPQAPVAQPRVSRQPQKPDPLLGQIKLLSAELAKRLATNQDIGDDFAQELQSLFSKTKIVRENFIRHQRMEYVENLYAQWKTQQSTDKVILKSQDGQIFEIPVITALYCPQ